MMTRDEQLRAAREFLGLPHPAEKDEVTAALHYIEFRDRNFQATRRRYSKPAKRAAGNLANAWVRAHENGLPLPPSSWLLFYEHTASAKGYLGQPGKQPGRGGGFKQRLALQQAFFLLSDRNRPCTVSLNGDWCKLAAILLGMPRPRPGLLSQARQLRTILLS
jgi:hypothetical protein